MKGNRDSCILALHQGMETQTGINHPKAVHLGSPASYFHCCLRIEGQQKVSQAWCVCVCVPALFCSRVYWLQASSLVGPCAKPHVSIRNPYASPWKGSKTAIFWPCERFSRKESCHMVSTYLSMRQVLPKTPLPKMSSCSIP